MAILMWCTLGTNVNQMIVARLQLQFKRRKRESLENTQMPRVFILVLITQLL